MGPQYRARPKAAEDDDEDAYDEDLVYSKRNHVYFYTNVNMKSINALYGELEIARVAAIEYSTAGEWPVIYLHIQSEGGDLYPGLACMDRLIEMSNTVEVCGLVEGYVASAASLIAIGCSYVRMQKHAYMLIHQMSLTQFGGQLRDVQQEFDNSHELEKDLRSVYRERTGLSQKKLDDLFSKESPMNARDCLKYQIVDEIA